MPNFFLMVPVVVSSLDYRKQEDVGSISARGIYQFLLISVFILSLKFINCFDQTLRQSGGGSKNVLEETRQKTNFSNH